VTIDVRFVVESLVELLVLPRELCGVKTAYQMSALVVLRCCPAIFVDQETCHCEDEPFFSRCHGIDVVDIVESSATRERNSGGADSGSSLPL